MKKSLLLIMAVLACSRALPQPPDYNMLFKSALEMYGKGNYQGSKVRFNIAQRKADKDINYYGRQQALEYMDRADECAQLIKDGDRSFSLGEYEIAMKYYDRIAELNPKDPENLSRALKCRNETDYLNTKKKGDEFFDNKEWNQANVLYMVCLDSTKRDLNSYKRYAVEIDKRNQECIRQINMFNPDSLKLKLKSLKDKLNKKKKPEENDKEKEKGKGQHGFLWNPEPGRTARLIIFKNALFLYSSLRSDSPFDLLCS